MSTRAIPRVLHFSRRSATRPSPLFRRHQAGGRRFQSTSEAPPIEEAQSTFRRIWNSPVGVKTVHFWAPVMKWALVLAGISDFWRPVENLSLTQNLALTATGAIWTRWCFIIKPRNMLLAAVNFFLGCVGVTQVTRILMYQRSAKGAPSGDVGSIKETAEGVVEKVESVAKTA